MSRSQAKGSSLMNCSPWLNQNQDDCIAVSFLPLISEARSTKSVCSYFGSGRTKGGGT